MWNLNHFDITYSLFVYVYVCWYVYMYDEYAYMST